MLSYILIIIIAYLLGNISTSYIIAKKMIGVDIRTQGSGNAGSTNVLRTLGKKAGAMTFIGDLLKGVVAVFIAQLIAKVSGLDIATAGYFGVFGVVCGHNWPVFLGFRGGKGVATSLGAMIAMNPVLALSCFAIFLVIVAITKYVSLGAIVGISMSP
uniref:glycerol-3-phosphate 1-O-acyltransferase PlsY n=2 Tax=Peptostreptococcaceae TaxID=186804 RepID=UPI00272B9DC9